MGPKPLTHEEVVEFAKKYLYFLGFDDSFLDEGFAASVALNEEQLKRLFAERVIGKPKFESYREIVKKHLVPMYTRHPRYPKDPAMYDARLDIVSILDSDRESMAAEVGHKVVNDIAKKLDKKLCLGVDEMFDDLAAVFYLYKVKSISILERLNPIRGLKNQIGLNNKVLDRARYVYWLENDQELYSELREEDPRVDCLLQASKLILALYFMMPDLNLEMMGKIAGKMLREADTSNYESALKYLNTLGKIRTIEN